MQKIFITGAGGYVGSKLVPALLEKNYLVTAFDLFIYGKDVLDNHKNLKIIVGDIRNENLLIESVPGHDAVIHLACISNDPSFELNPDLGKSINLNAFKPLVEISKKNNVKRFIYASSSSVYGLKKEKNITENVSLEPLTDYSKFKADCEKILIPYNSEQFNTVTLRPATICGYARRQRLDVVVNILTNLAYNKREISIFGGKQLRPNIHIKDMIRSYLMILEKKNSEISGEIFNVGYDNLSIEDIALKVKKIIGPDVKLKSLQNTCIYLNNISKIFFLLFLAFIQLFEFRKKALLIFSWSHDGNPKNLKVPGSVSGKQNIAGELHFDTYYHSLKAFTPLEDVTLENGPFAYLEGSANDKNLLDNYVNALNLKHNLPSNCNKPHQVSIDFIKNNNYEKKIFYGTQKKGDLVIMDTKGVHFASSLKKGQRQLFWFYY